MTTEELHWARCGWVFTPRPPQVAWISTDCGRVEPDCFKTEAVKPGDPCPFCGRRVHFVNQPWTLG